MRILVVEDEPAMSAAIRRVLVAERHTVDIANDGVTALDLAGESDFDVIILDRVLSDLEGLEVLRLLRLRGISNPVLMLTALGGPDHRLSGLDAGADDHLPKPFAFEELLARLRALARRPPELTGELLTAGDIELGPGRHRMVVGERSEDLSTREYALLGTSSVRRGGW